MMMTTFCVSSSLSGLRPDEEEITLQFLTS